MGADVVEGLAHERIACGHHVRRGARNDAARADEDKVGDCL